MPIQRNNDEKRAAIADRLFQEHRGRRAHGRRKTPMRNPDGRERRVQSERRRADGSYGRLTDGADMRRSQQAKADVGPETRSVKAS